MDNICDWLQYIGQWLESGAHPTIPFIGIASGRIYNPPRPHIEMVFVLTGGYPEVRIGELPVSIPTNHVTLHNVHFGNYAPPVPGTTNWCLFLDVSGCDAFAELAGAPLFYSMPVAQPQQLVDRFTRLKQSCSVPGTLPPHYLDGPLAFTPDEADLTRRMRVRAALLELVAELLDNTRVLRDDGPPSLPPSLLRAQNFMAAHSTTADVGLEDVARAAQLSIDHFGRLFKQYLGMTPMQYLRALRIKQSQFLLAHTGLRIEEIAVQVGFSDSFYFTRVFTTTTGMNPSQYRREHKAPDIRDQQINSAENPM